MQKPSLNDPENPLWTPTDFAKAVPFAGLPSSLQQKFLAVKNAPEDSPETVTVPLRLSREVLRALRASGADWQSKVDALLRKQLAVKS